MVMAIQMKSNDNYTKLTPSKGTDDAAVDNPQLWQRYKRPTIGRAILKPHDRELRYCNYHDF